MTKFDPQKHHRRSIRLKHYDYSSTGAYFVTIVASHKGMIWRRECLFGEVVNGEMMLSQRGEIAVECWREIPDHFPHVELGAYVIMPNHMHGIIMITNNDVGATHASMGRGTIYRAPTENAEKFGEPVKGSLSTIIGTYKAAVTRAIGREMNESGIWQRNYYEHVIRNDRDLQNKTDYINANPLLWAEDDENPVNVNK